MGKLHCTTQAMSKEEFRSFLEAVNTDTALQEKLKDAAEPDAVAAIAQSAGFESVSSELVADFLEYAAAQSASAQETEQELSTVSGGLSGGAIAGIISGSVAGAAVVAGAVWACQSKSSNLTVTAVSSESFENEAWNKLLDMKAPRRGGWDAHDEWYPK